VCPCRRGFPLISFALESGDGPVLPAVLQSADHCLCVLLNSHGGAPFPLHRARRREGRRRGRERRARGCRGGAPAQGPGWVLWGQGGWGHGWEGAEEQLRGCGFWEASAGGAPKITLSGFVSYAMLKSSLRGNTYTWTVH